MKIKIGKKIYDSNDTAIMLYLTPGDKQKISTMAFSARVYSTRPEDDKRPAVEVQKQLRAFKVECMK